MAELFNALSSLPICTFAVFGLKQCAFYGYEAKFAVAYTSVLIVGIGSLLFHGTLLRAGQVLDEVPMLWASLAFLYIASSMDGPRPRLLASLCCYGIASTVVYFLGETAAPYR
eukprot:SAG31_NODE_30_length_32545_cov_9.378999_15_plen_113_part_00